MHRPKGLFIILIKFNTVTQSFVTVISIKSCNGLFPFSSLFIDNVRILLYLIRMMILFCETVRYISDINLLYGILRN